MPQGTQPPDNAICKASPHFPVRAPAWSVELQQSLEKILLHKQIEFKRKQMLLVKTAFLSGSVE